MPVILSQLLLILQAMVQLEPVLEPLVADAISVAKKAVAGTPLTVEDNESLDAVIQGLNAQVAAAAAAATAPAAS